MRDLSRIIDELTAMEDLKALIITSTKKDIFIAGADIKEIERIRSGTEARHLADLGKGIMERLYALDLVTVALINGACLGGGLELALACRYRGAALSKQVRIGFPEVRLGILPGWGGTQRLPRLIGLAPALDMILRGRIIGAEKALECGLVDRLFPEETSVNDCIDFVRRIQDNEGKIELERSQKKGALRRAFEHIAPCRAIIFGRLKRDTIKRTKGFYPAPLKIIDLMRQSYGLDIKKGLQIEGEAFSELVPLETSKNLIRVSYLKEEFEKFQWVDPAVKPAVINKCGVIGAGVMGEGIARLLSYYGIPTELKDADCTALKKAIRKTRGLFKYDLKRKKLKKQELDYKIGLIHPSLTYSSFKDLDLIIETASEDLNIKQQVFKEISRIVSHDTVLATNTSSFSLLKIAGPASVPERVVGMHFFNPVGRMRLVEIIRSPMTSEKTMATAISFARRIGKTPIIVKDISGFLINRIILPYLNESAFLIEEGLRIEDIDRIMRRFGMPMGPIELIDEIGVDVTHDVLKILQASYGTRMRVSSILGKVKGKGLMGKKTRAGFYIHRGRRRTSNHRIYRFIKDPGRRLISDGEAFKRLIYIMINEAARCLEEEVIDRPRVVDIGMIMGTGFPAFRGGLLRYADCIGIDNIVRGLEAMERGDERERFRPCNYLMRKAKKGQGFYQ